jgi:NAD(P)-dependent dehydrogenase (short-subunit alcohol dehydrogenase family)
MTNLEGKSAIVTGATRGIGLAIARALLERGARVFVCARDKEDVAQTVASLRDEHKQNIHGAACDVRNYDNGEFEVYQAKAVNGKFRVATEFTEL